MPKKRDSRPPRHLHLAPPAAAEPTFAELVAQAHAACKGQHWREMDALMERLARCPEAQQVRTTDPQTHYFALAAWHWQAVAEAAQEAEDEADQARVDLFADALKASHLALERLVQRASDRRGAPGGADPSLHDVCQDFLAEMEDEMRRALWEVEAERSDEELRRAEREAEHA